MTGADVEERVDQIDQLEGLRSTADNQQLLPLAFHVVDHSR
jgi:hypothetical protein